jgi:hypothetical protein
VSIACDPHREPSRRFAWAAPEQIAGCQRLSDRLTTSRSRELAAGACERGRLVGFGRCRRLEFDSRHTH